MFDTRTRDTDDIHFLESILTDREGINLTGKNNHRNAVGIGGRDAGNGVSSAGSAGDQGYADFIRCSGVGICSMSCTLFVSNKNVFEFILLIDRVKNIQHAAAGITKNVFNAFFGKRAYKYL